MSERPKRLALLASGEGTNVQAVLDACNTGRIDATVELVLSDVATAPVLDRARAAGVSRVVCQRRPTKGIDRQIWDQELAETVADAEPDWVVLAGFMRILSPTFLNVFANRVINLHPALPGELVGLHAIDRAFDEHRRGHRTSSGVMVHLVPDEGVDSGPVLASAKVLIHLHDDLQSFSNRMHTSEHQLLVDTLANLCSRPLTVSP